MQILCGPCHRERGYSGLPSGATPTHAHIDSRGGFRVLCTGCDKIRHLDSAGEPYDAAKYGYVPPALSTEVQDRIRVCR